MIFARTVSLEEGVANSLRSFRREPTGISVFAVDRAYDDQTLQALIKMEVACRIGLESLTQLPKECEDALREPIETLCRTTQRVVEGLSPGYKRRPV